MKHILLVDDDALIRELVKAILADQDVEIHEAENGDQAIEKIRKQEFDLILTDIIMPDKEGIETIIEIRKMNPEVKIIAMSGGGRLDAESYLNIARRLGVSATINKPFNPQELLSVVKEVLHQ